MTQEQRNQIWLSGVAMLIKHEAITAVTRQLAIHAIPLYISDEVIVIKVDLPSLRQKPTINRFELALKTWKPRARLFVTTSELYITPEEFMVLND